MSSKCTGLDVVAEDPVADDSLADHHDSLGASSSGELHRPAGAAVATSHPASPVHVDDGPIISVNETDDDHESWAKYTNFQIL